MRSLLFPIMIVIAAVLGQANAANTVGDTISVRRAFIEMPGSILDLLSRSTRLDMLDYYDADSLWMAPNALDGRSVLRKVTSDFIELQITSVSTLQIKVLPLKGKGDIVAVCYTIDSADASNDSELRFFNSQMQELPAKNFFKPLQLKDFFNIPKGSLTTMGEIRQMVPFPTVEYKLEAGNADLTARLTVKEYINQDDIKILELFQRPKLTFGWDGKKFVQMK